MAQWLKQSTAVSNLEIGPFVDSLDGDTAETGLTIAQADVRLSQNGGVPAQKNDVTGATHREAGMYTININATDTNTLGRLRISVHVAGALYVWQDYMIVPANVYDSLIAGSDNLQTDAIEIEGSDPTDQINAACDAAIETYNLDHLMKTAVGNNADMTTEVADGTVLSNIMTKGSDTSDFVVSTESLEAIRDRGDAAWITGSVSYTINPIAVTVSAGEVSEQALAGYNGSQNVYVFTVVDSTGAAVDLSGSTLRLLVYKHSDPTHAIAQKKTGGDGITVGGASNNQVTVTMAGADMKGPANLRYVLKDDTNDGQVRAAGTLTIEPNPA